MSKGTLFKILERLTQRKIWYSFQSQHNGYYHLMVMNTEDWKEIQGYHSFEQLESWLFNMWGHILKEFPAPPRLK